MRARRAGWAAAALCGLVFGASAEELRQPVIGDVVVTAYVDNGGRQDYQCNGHTYAGHRGTDLGIIGRFAAQDAGRDVVAAAPGRVVRRHDGEFDRCQTGDCAGGGGFGNHVAIEHPDGMVTWYAHLRNGSVRVQLDDQVACGQVIGQVGSSGWSTGPHLHFEVRPGGVGAAADDPFSGPCGGPLSYWVEQGAYRGLPGGRCAEGPAPEPEPEPDPPAGPDMHLATALELPPRVCDFEDCADTIRDGSSGGVPDAWVGETLRWVVLVHNRGAGRTAGESPDDAAVELRYTVPAGLIPLAYTIETDHPAHDRASWVRNDAMDNPANPSADAPPRDGTLRLNGYGPDEAKRVVMTLRADDRAVDGVELRAWIGHMRDHYGEKTGWDDPVEQNRGQSFNGGDLRIGQRLGLFDARRFLFDSADMASIEGWRRCGDDVGRLHLNTGEAALAIEVLGDRPCVESPPIAVDTTGLAGIRLRVRQHQAPRTGVIGWSTADDPSFDRSRQVVFETAGGGAFEELHLGPTWSGTVTRLRLWPVLSNGEGDPWFDVGEVRLVAEAPGAPGEPGEPGEPEPGEPEPGGPEPGEPEPTPDPEAPAPEPDPEPAPGPGPLDGGPPGAEPAAGVTGTADGCAVSAPGAPGAPLGLVWLAGLLMYGVWRRRP